MKGCFDIELSKIFLERYYSELKIKYMGYYVVPVPSYIEDDEKRGFNHVIELFKPLNLNMLLVLKKTSHFKQAEHSGNSRANIEQFIELINSIELRNKNLLLVDDVFTTGSTIKACIKLLKQLKPRRIKVLVMSKTPFKKPLAQTN
ncbi:MAG: ComF family protein [Bacilli bacterium]|nr:ComF family protein [Bacilli bacterium]